MLRAVVKAADHDQPPVLVGGAVRDALGGGGGGARPIADLDVSVPSGALDLARRVADRLGGAFVGAGVDRISFTRRPSGTTFWRGEFYFATLRGESLRRVELDDGSEQVLLDGEYGRLRTVRVGPDDALYVLTSNRDGRGSPADGDDRVLRLTAP